MKVVQARDGGLGIQAIRSKGGFTIVQDPSTAESTGMPTTIRNPRSEARNKFE